MDFKLYMHGKKDKKYTEMFPVAIFRLPNLGDCFLSYLYLSKLLKRII